MTKQSVLSIHAKAATAILRMANTGLCDEKPMRDIIDCYKRGQSIEPEPLYLLFDLCDALSIPLDCGAEHFNPDTVARESSGMMPLEHWH